MEHRTEQIGDVTIHCSNCNNVLKDISIASLNVVVTDPPYNIGYKYNQYNDNLRYDDYLESQREILLSCASVIKDGGSILYLNYPEFAARIFWMFHNTFVAHSSVYPFLNPYKMITWIYHNHTGGKPLRKGTRIWNWWVVNQDEPNFIDTEACLGEYRNPNDKRIKKMISEGRRPVDLDWWMYEQVKNVSKEKLDHPCQLPLKMVQRLCKMVCPIGGTILDPFAGSGTTIEACINNDQKCVAIEMDEKYFDICVERAKTAWRKNN